MAHLIDRRVDAAIVGTPARNRRHAVRPALSRSRGSVNTSHETSQSKKGGLHASETRVRHRRGPGPGGSRERDGTIAGTADEQALAAHMLTTGRLHLGEVEFDTKRESWGFRATQADDAEHVIFFRRQ